MAKTNVKVKQPTTYTHEGSVAHKDNPETKLRRLVMSCMLWEDSFYVDGKSIAEAITEQVSKVNASKVAQIALEARTDMKLRHAPLWLARSMAKSAQHKHLVADTLAAVIQRADELTEAVSLYWKDGRKPLSAQYKKGLARAFKKFNAYSLQKYNSDSATVKLKDVMRLVHPTPDSTEQEKLWHDLLHDSLPTPETWETKLSATKGENKKAAWIDLLENNQLGALALLRNLRNMTQCGVDNSLIKKALKNIKTERVLPFRFIAAARYAPQFEPELEVAMLKCITEMPKLDGETILLVDVSGSMESTVSGKSEISRIDAACGLSMLTRELCDNVSVYTFSDTCLMVPARRGFALRDAIVDSQYHSGTALAGALKRIPPAKRLIVITDEQSSDGRIANDSKWDNAYVVNVAPNYNGVARSGKWEQINGWSERIIDYIQMVEA